MSNFSQLERDAEALTKKPDVTTKELAEMVLRLCKEVKEMEERDSTLAAQRRALRGAD